MPTTFHLDSIDGAIALLTETLDAQVHLAMEAVAENVAASAQQRHSFTNRTGRLEKHILPGPVTGSVRRGEVKAKVLGATPYGSFVEDGTSRSRPYPYLTPAVERTEPENIADLERALAEAVQNAGW